MEGTPDTRTAARAPGATPSSDPPVSPEWLASLREACELLWPPPAVITMELGRAARRGPARALSLRTRAPARDAGSEFALIPGMRRPPLLVPAGRRTAAAAVRNHSGPASWPARLGVRALSLGLACGLGGPLLRGRVRVSAPAEADSIEDYLGSVMSRPIRVSMQLGPARANRKPVLQMFTESGEPAGFVKVGVNPLTQGLVRAEHDSLGQLRKAGLAAIVVPEVLHYGRWHGFDVLMLSILPTWRHRRRLSPERLAAAMTELAGVGGLRRAPLGDDGYLSRLRARLANADSSAGRDTLLAALDALAATSAGHVLTFGCWHGDWAPWNMASTSQGLLVWDWERFDSGVPLGFDALHYRLQAEVAKGRQDPRAAASRCLERAPQQLAAFGLSARQAQLTAILYLADLSTRYLVDRQAEAGARLGAAGDWLVPAVVAGVQRL